MKFYPMRINTCDNFLSVNGYFNVGVNKNEYDAFRFYCLAQKVLCLEIQILVTVRDYSFAKTLKAKFNRYTLKIFF